MVGSVGSTWLLSSCFPLLCGVIQKWRRRFQSQHEAVEAPTPTHAALNPFSVHFTECNPPCQLQSPSSFITVRLSIRLSPQSDVVRSLQVPPAHQLSSRQCGTYRVPRPLVLPCSPLRLACFKLASARSCMSYPQGHPGMAAVSPPHSTVLQSNNGNPYNRYSFAPQHSLQGHSPHQPFPPSPNLPAAAVTSSSYPMPGMLRHHSAPQFHDPFSEQQVQEDEVYYPPPQQSGHAQRYPPSPIQALQLQQQQQRALEQQQQQQHLQRHLQRSQLADQDREVAYRQREQLYQQQIQQHALQQQNSMLQQPRAERDQQRAEREQQLQQYAMSALEQHYQQQQQQQQQQAHQLRHLQAMEQQQQQQRRPPLPPQSQQREPLAFPASPQRSLPSQQLSQHQPPFSPAPSQLSQASPHRATHPGGFPQSPMAPPGLPFPTAAMLSASPSHRQPLPAAGARIDNVMDMLSQILAPQISQKLRDASPSPEPYQPQHQQQDNPFLYPSHQSQQYQSQQHQLSHQQQLPAQPPTSTDMHQHHSAHHTDGGQPSSIHRSVSAPYNAPGMPGPVAPQPHHQHSAYSSPFSPSTAGAFNFNSFLTSLSPSVEDDPMPPVPSHALGEQELLHHVHSQPQYSQRCAPPSMSTLPSMKPLPSPSSAGPSKYVRSSAASGSGAINAITRFAVGPPNNETVGFSGVSSRARRGGRAGGGGGRGGGRAVSSNSDRRSSNNSDRERDGRTPSANGGGSEHGDDGWSVVESKKHHHHRDHSAAHPFNPHSPTFASALSPASVAALPARLLPSSKLLGEGRVAAMYVRTVEFDDESGEEMVVYVLNRPSATRI